MDNIINELVDSIVVNKTAKGYAYLKEAIEIAAKDMDKLERISREIYQPIAEKNNVTPNAVQQAITRTIAHTWEHGDWETLQRYFGYTISSPVGKPTTCEFISLLADKVWLMSRCK